MIIFFEDTEIARFVPARIALYPASLLDAGKSNHIAYSILSLVMAFSCRPTPAPVYREALSKLRTHQSSFPGSASCYGISTKKFANICPFIAWQGLY